MKAIKLIENNYNEIIKIAKKNGVLKISLFGSSVRKEDNEDSDIDLLVIFEEGRSLFDLIRLKQQLEELLDKKVDVVTENSIHPLLKKQILSEAVQL